MGDALYTCIKTEHLSSVYTVQCTVLKLWLHCVTLLHCYTVTLCVTLSYIVCHIVLHCVSHCHIVVTIQLFY